MQNEEKAKQLYHKYRDTNFAPESAAFNATMEMAEWKEQQICDNLMKFISNYFFNHPDQYRVVCSESFTSVSDLMEKIKQEIKKY